jgi:hypothetical protein
MSSDGNTNRPFPSLVLLGIVDFCCILIGLEQISAKNVASGAIWICVGVGSGLIGFYWSEIKQRIARVTAWSRKDFEIKRLKTEIEMLQASQPKPSQYPIPDLRLKVVSMVSELQGFLGEHGEPPATRLPGESTKDAALRYFKGGDPWKARFIGGYSIKFGQSVPELRDEMRLRCGIDYPPLNFAIQQATDRDAAVGAVKEIIDFLWDLAKDINA